MKRCLYYSQQWRNAREKLPGSPSRPVEWWAEGGRDDDAPNQEPGGDDGALIDPSLNPSVKGRLDGLVETFVCGFPKAQLIRRVGFGMDPPFQRMRGRYSSVVEMRTQATRTFGFFVRPKVYVAHWLDLADNTHADSSLYNEYGDNVIALIALMSWNEVDRITDVKDLMGD